MANHSEWVAFFHPIRQESNESFKGENPEVGETLERENVMKAKIEDISRSSKWSTVFIQPTSYDHLKD